MTAKNLTLTLIALTSVILLLGLGSTLTFGNPSRALTISDNSTTIRLTNNQNLSDDVHLSYNSPDGFTYSISPQDVFGLNFSDNKQIIVSLLSVPTGLKFGSYSTILIAQGTNGSANATITFNKGFCKFPASEDLNNNNLSLERVDVSSDGDDDYIWKPLDSVTIKVRVSNNGDNDISSIYAEIGLLDSSGRNVINNLDFANSDEEKIKLGTINDGDDKTATFDFQVPADFNEGDYRLVVKAYSKSDSEGNYCVDTSSDLDNTLFGRITSEKQDDDSKLIAFTNIEVSPTQATCGDQVTITANAVNVGNDDQDRVQLNLYSKDLKVDLSNEILQGINSGDDYRTSFTFTVPQGLANKIYKLQLNADYDYSSSSKYRESSDDTDVSLEILGCNSQSSSNYFADISASLQSEAVAGSPLSVRATITNLQNSTATFVVSATGYESWAELSGISSRVITLVPGQSKDIIINLDVNSDASGSESFTIDVSSNGQAVSQDVEVNIGSTSKSASSLSSLFSGNGLIWAIGIINIVLIVLIIIVAVRLSRK